MEYTKSQLNSTITVKFETNEEEWNEAMQASFVKTRGQYKVEGFRQGKAPRHMIEKLYGAQVFADDAMDSLINDGYFKFIKENADLDIIDRPQVAIDEFDGKVMKYTITVTVKPEIKISQYKGIELPKIEYNVTDEQVKEEIDRVKERSARIVEVERASQNGDIVNINYCGSVDGVKFDGGEAEKYDLTLGSNTFIPGFEEQLVGFTAGSEVDVTVKFPDEYHAENLKGKEAIFACKVNTVSEKQLPDEDDKWASEVSQFATLAEYKADILAKLTADAERRAKTDRENAVINAVVDNTECEMPDCLAESYLEDMIRDLEMKLQYQGLKIEDYFKYTGTTVEKYKEDKKEEAKRGALTRLCLEEIIKLEKITATEQEAKDKYAELYADDNKEVNENELRYLQNEIGMNKLLELLVGNTVWTDK